MVVARLNPFLLGNPIFKGYLSFREGILPAKTEEPIDSSSLAWSSFLSSSRSRRRMYGLKRSAYLNVSTTTNVLWRLKWIHPLAKVRNHELQLEIPIEPLPSFQRESWNQNGWMSIPFDNSKVTVPQVNRPRVPNSAMSRYAIGSTAKTKSNNSLVAVPNSAKITGGYMGEFQGQSKRN